MFRDVGRISTLSLALGSVADLGHPSRQRGRIVTPIGSEDSEDFWAERQQPRWAWSPRLARHGPPTVRSAKAAREICAASCGRARCSSSERDLNPPPPPV